MQYRLHISTFEFGWHYAYIGYYAKIFLMVSEIQRTLGISYIYGEHLQIGEYCVQHCS